MLWRRIQVGLGVQWRQFLYGSSLQRGETSLGSQNGTKVIVEENKLACLLRTRFPNATYIQVADISGGCGAMFEVSVESEEFKGLSIVKQHRLVTEVLSKQIKQMHGIRIQTSLPPDK